MERGIDSSPGTGSRRWDIASIVIEADDIAYRARRHIWRAMIGIGLRTFYHTCNSLQYLLIIGIIISRAPTLDHGNSDGMTLWIKPLLLLNVALLSDLHTCNLI